MNRGFFWSQDFGGGFGFVLSQSSKAWLTAASILKPLSAASDLTKRKKLLRRGPTTFSTSRKAT